MECDFFSWSVEIIIIIIGVMIVTVMVVVPSITGLDHVRIKQALSEFPEMMMDDASHSCCSVLVF